MKIRKEHIVIVRSYGDILDLDSYNCQELGLAKALVKRGYKVTFLMPDKKENTTYYATDYGQIAINRIKILWRIHARYCWFRRLEEKLECLEPSIVQVHDMDLLMTWRCVRWAKAKNIPCYLIQGPYDKWEKKIFRQINELYNLTFGKYILKNVSGIGVKSMRAAEYLRMYYPINPILTNIGLDVSRFQGAVECNWRKRLNLIGKKVLLYVGSLQARRNPSFLIEILYNLPEEYVLIIAGEGKQKDEIENVIYEKELQNRCFLVGKLGQQELPSLYHSCDCFLLASDYEILGMVIMEAMYFGLPVISTKTTGASSIIHNNEDGFIIDSKDTSRWIEIIISLLENEEQKKRVAFLAKKNIELNFIWDKTCESFIKLYCK